MKRLSILLLVLLAGFARAQFAQAQTSSNSATITVSGSTKNLSGPGNSGTFEEILTGSPATVSIVLQGCMKGNTCDVLETNTSTTASQNRKPTISTLYDFFTVTATWTGGTNVSITVNATVAVSGKGNGGGNGNGATTCGGLSDATLCNASIPLPVSQGGTNATTAAAALTNLGAEATANKDAVNGYAGLDAGGLLKTAELPTPTTTTFGGVKDKAAVSHNFITSIVGGVPVQGRPVCADLTDAGTGCSATLATVATSGSAADLGGTLALGRFPAFTNHALVFGSGSAGSPNFLASPTANGFYSCGFNIVASAAVDPSCLLSGVPTNAQTGTSYTILYSDRLGYLSFSNASSIAVTLPQAGGVGFTNNFSFAVCDIGAGTATITPTTSTISSSNGKAYTSAASSLALSTGQCAWIYSDNTNYFAIVHGGAATGLTVTAGKTLTVSNSLTLAGTDGTTMTFPSASATITQTIASGTITVTGDAPTSGACAAEHTVSIAALLTSDLVKVGFNGDPTAVTGIAPVSTGGVYIVAYPKAAGTLGLKVCNDTAGTITVGTLVLNYAVMR